MCMIIVGFAFGNNIGTYILFGVIFAILVFILWAPIHSRRETKKALEKMDTPAEEPALLEQSAVVLDKYCYAKASRRSSPLHDKHFFVKFQTEDGKTVEYPVWEEFYLSVYEGQTGTLATANGNFYGFCED